MPEIIEIKGGYLSVIFLLIASLFLLFGYISYYQGIRYGKQFIVLSEAPLLFAGCVTILNNLNGMTNDLYIYFLVFYSVLTLVAALRALYVYEFEPPPFRLGVNSYDSSFVAGASTFCLIALIGERHSLWVIAAIITSFIPIWRAVLREKLENAFDADSIPDSFPWAVWTTGWFFASAALLIEYLAFPSKTSAGILHPLTYMSCCASVLVMSKLKLR